MGGNSESRNTETRTSLLGPILLTSAVFAVLLGITRWAYVTAYRLQGDDFALVLNSSAPYTGIREWPKWFTEGYSTYFVNYPDWPSVGTDFSRPLVNLAFAIQGTLVEGFGDPAYLIAGYLAAVVTVGFVVGILLSQTDASPVAAAALGLTVGLSPTWYPALSYASFASNAFALMFATAALFVLDPKRGVPKGGQLASCLALQVAAVLSHETAVVLPLVSVALLFALSPRAPRWSELAGFALPVGVFVAARLVLNSAGDVYALTTYGLWSAVKRTGAFLVGPLAPFDLFGPLLANMQMTPLAVGVYAFALVANLVLLATVITGIIERPSRVTAWAMVAALLFARAPGLAGRMEPRFLGIAFVVALVCAIQVRSEGFRGRLVRATVIVLVLSHLGLFYVDMIDMQREEIALAQQAGDFFDSMRESAKEENPSTIVLVNDRYGMYGARAMIHMAVWPQQDIRAVITNSYLGPLAAHDGVLEIVVEEGRLDAVIGLGDGQEFLFAGTVPDLHASNQGFAYEVAEVDDEGEMRALRVTGPLSEHDALVVGVDPLTGTRITPRRF